MALAWALSGAAIRKKLFAPPGRAGTWQLARLAVRQLAVAEGLTNARLYWLATGISAFASVELNGPTMPRISESTPIRLMFCVPLAGSWTPARESSNGLKIRRK